MLAHSFDPADGGFPNFDWHATVVPVAALIVIAYVLSIRRHRRTTGEFGISRFQIVALLGAFFAFAVASWYPIHDLAENRLFSVHMIQHSVYTLILAPLVIIGTPTWFQRAFLRRTGLFRLVRTAARFFPATILFNVVLIVTHVPSYVNTVVGSEPLHFLTHTLIVATALTVWMPVLSPLPEIPRIEGPLGMFYLFLQSIVPTIPASFLTFGNKPLYHYYADLPRIWGVSALDDMQMAGMVMKILNGLFTWVVIAIVFFRWYDAEETPGRSRRRDPAYDQLDRELIALPTALDVSP